MIRPSAILDYDFGNPEQAYVERDAILYALGVGLGADPCGRDELRYLDERSLSVLPTYAVTLCSPGMWIREPALGVDFGKLVHFAQSAEFFEPLPSRAQVIGQAKVVSLTDRGEGRGAVLVLERTIRDAASGALYCRLHQTLLLRGDGGFGGEPAARDEKFDPQTPPDAVATFQISPRSALIYRLSGDWNPLHLDPDFALAAGFSRPILQGLCSYAIAGFAISRALGREAALVAQLACRFSGVVMPGDTMRLEIWNDAGEGARRFRAFADERKILDAGEISWREHAQ